MAAAVVAVAELALGGEVAVAELALGGEVAVAELALGGMLGGPPEFVRNQ